MPREQGIAWVRREGIYPLALKEPGGRRDVLRPLPPSNLSVPGDRTGFVLRTFYATTRSAWFQHSSMPPPKNPKILFPRDVAPSAFRFLSPAFLPQRFVCFSPVRVVEVVPAVVAPQQKAKGFPRNRHVWCSSKKRDSAKMSQQKRVTRTRPITEHSWAERLCNFHEQETIKR